MLPMAEIVGIIRNGWGRHRRINIERWQPTSVTEVIGAENAEVAEVIEVVEAIRGEMAGTGVLKVGSAEVGPFEVKATGAEFVKVEAIELETVGVEIGFGMPGLRQVPCKAITVSKAAAVPIPERPACQAWCLLAHCSCCLQA